MRANHFRKFQVAAAIALFTSVRSARGQDPSLPVAQPVVPPYHPPVIAVVQPPPGGVVPQDKPVIVIRFAAGEAGDPVDARSFALSVDGEDRTSLFQLSATEAWGPLATIPADLSLGTHELAARICSARGTCSSATAQVTVARPTVAITDPANGKAASRKKRVIDALFGALRTLLRQ